MAKQSSIYLASSLRSVLTMLDVGGGGDPNPNSPAWLVGLELVNDLATTNTVAGTVKSQSNGLLLRVYHNLGALSSWDASKVSMPVAMDPGFLPDGTPTNNPRLLPIVGVGRWYKPYPETDDAGNAKYTDVDAGVNYIDIGLSQRLYNSLKTDYTGRTYMTNPGSIVFETGFLNGNSAAGNTTAIARSDTLDYWDPVWKHLNPPQQRVSANGSIVIEWTAGHRFAQQTQPIACLEAWTWDGTNAGSIVRASEVEESSWTLGLASKSGLTADVFKTNMSFAGRPNGMLGVRSRAKPWVGPAIESTDAGVGDDFDVAHTQNLLASFPVYHDLLDTRSDRFAKWNHDGSGRATADAAGILASKAAALADQGFATARLAMESMVLYNNNVANRPNGVHDTTDGLRIVCPTVAGTKGTDAGAYAFNTQLTAKTGFFPVTIESESGVANNSSRLRGKTSAGASISLATKTPGGNFRKIRLKGFFLDSTGIAAGDDRTVINFGAGAAGPNPGATAYYAILEDCEVEGAEAGSARVPFDSTQVVYLYNSRIKNNRYRTGFAGMAGAVVQIGCKMEGDTNVDGTCAIACWMTNGEVTGVQNDIGNQVAFNQASSPRSHPSMSPTKQFIIHNCRFDTWNWGGLGGCNDPAGRADQILGRYWAGIIFGGRYANVNNTHIDFSDDLIIPGTERNVLIGLTTAVGTNSYSAMRMNNMYQDHGWVRTDKSQAILFSYVPAMPCKTSWFAANASVESGPVAAPAQIWSNTTRYYAGDLVYDNTGGLTPQTGAPTYQAYQHIGGLGARISSVPPGTPLTDANYWYAAPNNLTGSQPRRTGNEAYLMAGDIYCLLGSGAFYEGGAHSPGPFGELMHYVPAGTFDIGGGQSSFHQIVKTSLYINDTSGPGADPAVQNFRPKPGSPLIGRRPANLAWDKRDQLGQLRPTSSAGAAAALEIIPDLIPDSYTFVDQTGVDPSSVRTSAPVTISGFNTPISITVSAGALYSINSTADVDYTSSPGVLQPPSAIVRLRRTSSATPGGEVTTTVNIGGVQDTWSVTTAESGAVPSLTTPGTITGMNEDGTADPGVELTYVPAAWAGSPNSVSFQWYEDDVPVGVTDVPTYTPNRNTFGSVTIYVAEMAHNANGWSNIEPSNPVNTFDPSQVGLITDFFPSDISQLSLSGANVEAWTADGTSPVTLFDVGASAPQYSATGFNGKPGVTGNGTSQYLHVGIVEMSLPTALAGIPAGSTPCEVWAVVNQPDADSVTTTRMIFGWGAETTQDQRVRSLAKQRTSNIASLTAATGTGSAAQYAQRIPAANGFVGRHVVHGIWTATQTTAEIDGVAGTVVNAVPNTTAARMRMFCNPANAGTNTPQHFSNATVYRIMISPILNASRRQSMQRWCASAAA